VWLFLSLGVWLTRNENRLYGFLSENSVVLIVIEQVNAHYLKMKKNVEEGGRRLVLNCVLPMCDT